MKAKQTVIDVKSTATRSVRADRVFAKSRSRRDKLSAQLKHEKTKNYVEKMQLASANLAAWKYWSEDQTKHNVKQTKLAFSLASSNLVSWKSWTEGQTQCLQQEVTMNRKTIDGQSKELTEKGQQLITARLKKRKNQWLRASKYQDTFRRGKEM